MSTSFYPQLPDLGDWLQRSHEQEHTHEQEQKCVHWNASKGPQRVLDFLQSGVAVEDVPSCCVNENSEPTADRFHRLADEWYRQVGNVSSLTAMTKHPKYREIVNLGWDAVPFMLDDLRRNHGVWFSALEEITKIRPFDPSDAGNSKRMIEAWVQWGKRKKLIDATHTP